MSRPEGYRHICALPRCSSFDPPEGTADGRVKIAVEEYEAIRLTDLLGCTQEEYATQVRVARSAVQQVYDTARHRLAQVLMEGRHLHISDGDYMLYPRGEECPGRDCAQRDRGMGRCGRGACLRSKEN